MIPQELLTLACREFPSRENAIAASPYGDEVIRWLEQPDIPIMSWREIPETVITSRTMRLQQLPSVFWAWVPDHPDDLVVVAEHKREINKEFGATQMLTAQGIVLPERNENYLKVIRESARRQLAEGFIAVIEEGKIYRTAYMEESGKISHYGRIADKISVCLLYAEEIYSDTPLQKPS